MSRVKREQEIINQAYSKANKGCPREGIAMLEKLNSDTPKVLETLAELYYNNRQAYKGIRLLSGRSKLTLGMTKWLAKSYLYLGDTKSALDVLKPVSSRKSLQSVYEEVKMSEVKKSSTISTQKKITRTKQPKPIKIFISHTHNDAEQARRLLSFLCSALGIKKSDIRCTSVAGAKLAIGADISMELANDILRSKVLIGLLTEKSTQSAYVLFELGASWIMDYSKPNHRTIPILGHGVSNEILPGPLQTRHASKANKRSDMLQMLQEISKILSIELLPPDQYDDELHAFIGYRPPK